MRYLIAAALIVATPALATDFSRPIRDVDGKPICMAAQAKDTDACPDDQLATLSKVVRAALYAPVAKEQGMSDEMLLNHKLRLGDLAQSIAAGGDVKLKSEDIVLIKKAVSSSFTSPLMVWAVTRELEAK